MTSMFLADNNQTPIPTLVRLYKLTTQPTTARTRYFSRDDRENLAHRVLRNIRSRKGSLTQDEIALLKAANDSDLLYGIR
jgi:hypothetical protein